MSRLLLKARAAGTRLRRAVADGAGAVPSAALTDGIELFCGPPIRVVFADAALSALLFEGAPPSDLAFSGPAAEFGADEIADEGDEARGGYVCLRAGVLRRICEGDPVARFALLHEIGHRINGDRASLRFSARTVEEEKLFVTHRFRRQRIDADRLAAVTGERAAWRRARRKTAWRPSGAALLEQEAAANIFAFYALADPRSFDPARDDLSLWAAARGAPLIAAETLLRAAPELFGPQPDPRRILWPAPWPSRRLSAAARAAAAEGG